MTSNRRRFSRIAFRIPAHLEMPDGHVTVELLDISLKGALVRPKAEFFAKIGSNGALQIVLDNQEATIRMDVTIVHREGNDLGLFCRDIDLDSITHLRRLVELNLGDTSVLNRELTALTR